MSMETTLLLSWCGCLDYLFVFLSFCSILLAREKGDFHIGRGSKKLGLQNVHPLRGPYFRTHNCSLKLRSVFSWVGLPRFDKKAMSHHCHFIISNFGHGFLYKVLKSNILLSTNKIARFGISSILDPSVGPPSNDSMDPTSMGHLILYNLPDTKIQVLFPIPTPHWYVQRNDTLGPLHTRDWEHVTITLQALSLVEKAEPVQVRFALRLRDQRSIYVNARWM